MFRNWEFLIMELWVHLLVAVLLTLVTCWMIWGRDRFKAEREKLKSTEAELDRAYKSIERAKTDISLSANKQQVLQAKLAKMQLELSAARDIQDADDGLGDVMLNRAKEISQKTASIAHDKWTGWSDSLSKRMRKD